MKYNFFGKYFLKHYEKRIFLEKNAKLRWKKIISAVRATNKYVRETGNKFDF